MTRMIWIAGVAALLAAGCKKSEPAAKPPTTEGSGTKAKATEVATPVVKVPTGADLAKRYDECWGYRNTAAWDDLKACYASGATHERPGSGETVARGDVAVVDAAKSHRAVFPEEKGVPQLILVSGKTVAALVVQSGTQSGKPYGVLAAQLQHVDDAGKISNEWDFIDMGTVLGQVTPKAEHPVRAVVDKAGEKQVIVAKGDEQEKANLATVQKAVEAFSKHDEKALGDLLADDVTWSAAAQPKDLLSKKEVLAHAQELWKGFSDLKITTAEAWAAGDRVVVVGSFDGTNDGDVPSMHLTKSGKKLALPFLAVYRLDGGKIKAESLFFEGGAIATQLATSAKPG